MRRYRLMQQRVGSAHRLLCPKECLPKHLGRKRPCLHRSSLGFFAPFPVLFGHRSLRPRLLPYSPHATNSTSSPVKWKLKKCCGSSEEEEKPVGGFFSLLEGRFGRQQEGGSPGLAPITGTN